MGGHAGRGLKGGLVKRARAHRVLFGQGLLLDNWKMKLGRGWVYLKLNFVYDCIVLCVFVRFCTVFNHSFGHDHSFVHIEDAE